MSSRLALLLAVSFSLVALAGCGDCADPSADGCDDGVYEDDDLSVAPPVSLTGREVCAAYLSCMADIEGLDGGPTAEDITGATEAFGDAGTCYDNGDEAGCGSICDGSRAAWWDLFPSVGSCRTPWFNSLPLEPVADRGWDVGDTVPEIIGDDQFGELVTVDQFQGRRVVLVFVDPETPAAGVDALEVADAWATANDDTLEVIAVVGVSPAQFAQDADRWQSPAIQHAGTNDAWPFEGMGEAAMILGSTLAIGREIESDLGALDVGAWMDEHLGGAR